MEWLWIPLTVGAAALQCLRSAVQKRLTGRLSTTGATLTRFLYGWPFALLYVLLLLALQHAWPVLTWGFLAWLIVGSLSQTLATQLLLSVLQFRNFAVGIAYTKTEVVQAAVFGLVFLGDAVSWTGAVAIAMGTAGIMLFSLQKSANPWRDALVGWTQRPALLGLVSAALFGLSAVAFRGASLNLEATTPFMSAAFALCASAILQSLMLLAYLKWREPGQIAAVWQARGVAIYAGVTGILASAGWFTAFTLQQVAYVRTLGLIEMIFTYLIARWGFREPPSRVEILGIALLTIAIALMLNLG